MYLCVVTTLARAASCHLANMMLALDASMRIDSAHNALQGHDKLYKSPSMPHKYLTRASVGQDPGLDP